MNVAGGGEMYSFLDLSDASHNSECEVLTSDDGSDDFDDILPPIDKTMKLQDEAADVETFMRNLDDIFATSTAKMQKMHPKVERLLDMTKRRGDNFMEEATIRSVKGRYVKEIKDLKQELQSVKTNAESEIAALKHTLQEKGRVVHEHETEIAALKQTLQEKNRVLHEHETKVANLTQKNDELHLQLTGTQSDIHALRTDEQTHTRTLQNLTLECQNLRHQLEGEKRSLQEARMAYENDKRKFCVELGQIMKKRKPDQIQTIEAMEQWIKAEAEVVVKDRASRTNELDDEREKAERLELNLKNLDKERQTLKAQLEALQTQCRDLEGYRSKYSGKCQAFDDLQKNADRVEAALKASEAKSTRLEKQLEEADRALEKTKQELKQELDQTQGCNNARQKKMTEELNEKDAKIQSFELELQKVTSLVAVLEDKNRRLTDEFTQRENNLKKQLMVLKNTGGQGVSSPPTTTSTFSDVPDDITAFIQGAMQK